MNGNFHEFFGRIYGKMHKIWPWQRAFFPQPSLDNGGFLCYTVP